jgi:hypothetical protein
MTLLSWKLLHVTIQHGMILKWDGNSDDNTVLNEYLYEF